MEWPILYNIRYKLIILLSIYILFSFDMQIFSVVEKK